jgi:hypothetical protein
MKQFLLGITVIMVTAISGNVQEAASADTSPGPASGIDINAEIQQAMDAVKAFAGSLQAELKKGMKQGGPVNAIEICNTRAARIAMDVSGKKGLSVQRVSLKNRNPANVPNAWQQKVLEDFEKRKLDGEPVGQLTYADVAENEDGKQFRFMKAIPTKAICIACHGADITPEVKERLDQLYPDDKARGFRPGDIRGAFVVTRDFPR